MNCFGETTLHLFVQSMSGTEDTKEAGYIITALLKEAGCYTQGDSEKNQELLTDILKRRSVSLNLIKNSKMKRERAAFTYIME